jgi:hypothetical protein
MNEMGGGVWPKPFQDPRSSGVSGSEEGLHRACSTPAWPTTATTGTSSAPSTR